MPQLSQGQLIQLSKFRTKAIKAYVRTHDLHGLPIEVYVDTLDWISATYNFTSFGAKNLHALKEHLNDAKLTSQQKAEVKRCADFMHYVEKNMKVTFQPLHFECNYCNSRMKIERLRNRDSYCCTNPCCDARVGVHKVDYMPLGTPANTSLRMHRKTCHLEFDKIWQKGLLSRDAAYRSVSSITNWSRAQCHIGKLENKQQCDTFIAAAKTVWSQESARIQILNA